MTARAPGPGFALPFRSGGPMVVRVTLFGPGGRAVPVRVADFGAWWPAWADPPFDHVWAIGSDAIEAQRRLLDLLGPRVAGPPDGT